MTVVAACALLALTVPTVGIATGDPSLGLIGGLAALVVVVLIAFASLRGFIATVCVFAIPPGVVGEVDVVAAGAAAIVLAVVTITYPLDRGAPNAGLRMLAIAAVLTPAVAMLILGYPQLAVVVGILAVVAALASRRVQLILDLTRGIGATLTILSASYFLTVLLGFAPTFIGKIDFGATRALEFYLPFTFATSGPPILEGTRRFAPLTGEPGLLALYLVPLVAALFVLKTARARFGVFVVITASTVASQSLATILLVSVAIVFGLLLRLSRRGGMTGAVLVGIPVAVGGVVVINNAVAFKSVIANESVTDRALGGQATALGNINIVVAATNNPTLAAVLILGLVAAGLSIRSIPAAVGWTLFAGVAAFAQPSQWQIGGWLLLGLVILASLPERKADAAPQPEDESTMFLSTGR